MSYDFSTSDPLALPAIELIVVDDTERYLSVFYEDSSDLAGEYTVTLLAQSGYEIPAESQISFTLSILDPCKDSGLV